MARIGTGLTGVVSGSASLGDLNEDDHLDLVVTGSGEDGSTTTVYLGDGQGGFSEANAGLTGVGFGSSTSIADVNNNGHLDLLITGFGPNGNRVATLYLGDGQGGFTEAGASLTGVDLSSSSIADVDGDGNQDLLITGRDANTNRTATLYLGNGDGTFSAADAGLTGVAAGSSSIADVNGDGNQDLLITGRDESPTTTATLYLGDGEGDFSEAGADLTGVEDGPISIADVNNDGNLDLLITGEDKDLIPTATLYLGDGQGGFTEANADLPGISVGSSSVADVDGDGNLDLLLTGLFEDDSLVDDYRGATLYLGDGQGGFTEANAGLNGFFGSNSIADVNEDGNLDLLITGNRTATLYVSNGEGKFYSARPNPVKRSTSSLGDVDGDGHLDLLITGEDRNQELTAMLYLGNGKGRFTAVNADLTGIITGSSSIADVNNDGNLDLLITGEDADENQTATLYLGDGQGEFTESDADLTGVEFGSTSIADVNGDRNMDLLITGRDANFNPTATLYLGDGQGGFTEADAGLSGVSFSSNSIADVNNDGHLDLLITGRDLDFNVSATLYLGDGQGGFSEANAGLTGVGFGSNSIGDVNNDGNLDLLITGEDANNNPTATVYLGDGQGGFSEAEAGLTGLSYGPATSITDANSDGNLDLLITGQDANDDPTATLYLGDGQGGFSEAGASLTGVGEGSTSVGDVDGDGHFDLLVTGSESATVYENLAGDNLLVEAASQSISSDGPVGFGNTGVGVDFSGTSGSGTVTVQKFANRPRVPLGIGTENVSDYRVVISAGGDLTFNANTEVRLDVSTLGGVGDASNVTVFRRSARDSGIFGALSTSYDSETNELVAQTGSFSEFALGSDTEPLPVDLAGFEARLEDEKVRLTWQTASETNNSGFDVQRRHSGKKSAWTKVGFVESKASGGTTSEAQSYRFTDADLPYAADLLEYRLKQVDTDGSVRYSEELTLKRGVTEVELLGTAPNPARSRTTVRYALPEKQNVTLRLYDALGRQVRTVLEAEKEGRHERQLNTSALPSGVYFLRLQTGGTTKTQKLTVVR